MKSKYPVVIILKHYCHWQVRDKSESPSCPGLGHIIGTYLIMISGTVSDGPTKLPMRWLCWDLTHMHRCTRLEVTHAGFHDKLWMLRVETEDVVVVGANTLDQSDYRLGEVCRFAPSANLDTSSLWPRSMLLHARFAYYIQLYISMH